MRKYKTGQYILYHYRVFLSIYSIFNSNLEICIIVEIIHDIGSMELFYLFTLSYIGLKTSFSFIFTPRLAIKSNKGPFWFLHLIIVNAAKQFYFF